MFWRCLSYRLCLLLVCVGFPALGERVYEKGEVFRAKIANLRPTQFTVGLDEIHLRADKYRDLRKLGDLQAHLEFEKPVDVIVGPGNQLFLVDGHHLTRTMHELGLKTVFVHVVKDWSKLAEDPVEAERLFWQKMKKRNRVYLLDNGNPKSHEELPQHVSDLKDDPYRTLAWLYQKSKGYAEDDADFQEFRWAEFFRKKDIEIKSRDKAGWKQALKDAHRAVRNATAREKERLPGYQPGSQLCLTYFKALYARQK